MSYYPLKILFVITRLATINFCENNTIMISIFFCSIYANKIRVHFGFFKQKINLKLKELLESFYFYIL